VSILEAPEYAHLSGRAVKLLLDLFSQYNGHNNGAFYVAWRVLEKRGWRSRGTLTRALRELEASRFILKTRQGGKHKPSLYAVTWLPIDECRGQLDVAATRVAPNSWKKSVTPKWCHIDTDTGPIITARHIN
jgi:hypothetical protein